MGFLDRITSWLGREAADVRDAVDDLTDRASADLDRRERELAATPEERMEMIQAEGDADDLLADLRDRIERAEATADATKEVADLDTDPTPPDPTTDPD